MTAIASGGKPTTYVSGSLLLWRQWWNSPQACIRGPLSWDWIVEGNSIRCSWQIWEGNLSAVKAQSYDNFAADQALSLSFFKVMMYFLAADQAISDFEVRLKHDSNVGKFGKSSNHVLVKERQNISYSILQIERIGGKKTWPPAQQDF